MKQQKNVVEKMIEEGYGFLTALLGKSDNKQLFFSSQPEYPTELIEWKRTSDEQQQLIIEIQKHESTIIKLLDIEDELKTIEMLLSEYIHEQKFFEEYLSKNETDKLKRFSFFRLNDKQIMSLIVELDITKKMNIFTKLKLFFKFGINDFKQFQDIEPILIGLKNEYYRTKIDELEKQKQSALDKLVTYNFNEEVQNLIGKSKEYFNATLAERYIYLEEREKFRESDYWKNDVFPSFIAEYPIILSTTHSIANSKNSQYIFDYVIVDEASQVELVPGIIALSVAKNAVIVGDLKQLPHIPDSSIKSEEYEELGAKFNVPDYYDYQKNSLLASVNHIFGTLVPNVLLKEHYRCHPKIISFCNKKYYNNELICHASVNSEKPLVLLRTVEGNHMRYGNHAANKITNIRELDALIDKTFLETAEIDFNSNRTFGFMAPFNGQVNASEKYFPEDFQKETVHKFQGRECDIVMFSSVLDKKGSTGKLLSFVDNPNLINVAISRAKEKFILVSNVDSFKKVNGEIADLIKYMEYYEDDSILYQSNIRSIFDLLYSDYLETLNKMKKSKYWGKSKYDSENIMEHTLNEILEENDYDKKYKVVSGIKLKELIRNMDTLADNEREYIKNGAHVDFVVYDAFNNQPVLAIEVDGFAFHENKPNQLVKDKLKDAIFLNDEITLLRFATNHSNEKSTIENIFSKLIDL